jgi:hypothetical protein
MKTIFKSIFLLLTPLYLFAHSLILDTMDNEDGTITVHGEFNTGESAAGALLKLEALNSGEILYQKRLPDDGELTIPIPKLPYQIILDGGPGHSVTKEGIAPIGGFEKQVEIKPKQKKQKPSRNMMQISSSKAVTYSIIAAFILLFATIFISIRNTNKLIKKIKEIPLK